MQTIDVGKLIRESGLDIKLVARHLFPGHIYAVTALQRILNGVGKLDSDQLSRLAMLLGTSVDQLYTSGWKHQSNDGTHIFTHADYTACVDLGDMSLKLWHKNSMFHTEVLLSKSILLTDLIEHIDKILDKHCPK